MTDYWRLITRNPPPPAPVAPTPPIKVTFTSGAVLAVECKRASIVSDRSPHGRIGSAFRAPVNHVMIQDSFTTATQATDHANHSMRCARAAQRAPEFVVRFSAFH